MLGTSPRVCELLRVQIELGVLAWYCHICNPSTSTCRRIQYVEHWGWVWYCGDMWEVDVGLQSYQIQRVSSWLPVTGIPT